MTDNTPLNVDDELDNLLGPCLAFILGPDDEGCLHCERVEAVLANRKKHELQARVSELQDAVTHINRGQYWRDYIERALEQHKQELESYE